MNYGWRFMTLYRRQGSRPSPRKSNAKKAKWLSGEALQIAVKRREPQSAPGLIFADCIELLHLWLQRI